MTSRTDARITRACDGRVWSVGGGEGSRGEGRGGVLLCPTDLLVNKSRKSKSSKLDFVHVND